MFHSDSGKRPRPKTWEQRILKAASYAACSQDHPVYRLEEDETRTGAYSLAFLDCLGGPQLVAVDSSRWTGRVGEWIHFHIRDNLRVMQVRVMIQENETCDMLLESGHACQSLLNPSIWTYTTRTEIRQTPGLCIYLLTNDLAGNIGADTVVFNYE